MSRDGHETLKLDIQTLAASFYANSPICIDLFSFTAARVSN